MKRVAPRASLGLEQCLVELEIGKDALVEEESV